MRVMVGKLERDLMGIKASIAGVSLVLPRRELAILDGLMRRAGQ